MRLQFMQHDNPTREELVKLRQILAKFLRVPWKDYRNGGEIETWNGVSAQKLLERLPAEGIDVQSAFVEPDSQTKLLVACLPTILAYYMDANNPNVQARNRIHQYLGYASRRPMYWGGYLSQDEIDFVGNFFGLRASNKNLVCFTWDVSETQTLLQHMALVAGHNLFVVPKIVSLPDLCRTFMNERDNRTKIEKLLQNPVVFVTDTTPNMKYFEAYSGMVTGFFSKRLQLNHETVFLVESQELTAAQTLDRVAVQRFLMDRTWLGRLSVAGYMQGALVKTVSTHSLLNVQVGA